MLETCFSYFPLQSLRSPPPSSLRFSLSLLFSEVYRKQARTGGAAAISTDSCLGEIGL